MKCKADSSHKYGHYFVFFKTLNVNVLIVLKYKSAFMLNIFCFHFITTKAGKPICFILCYPISLSYWSIENPKNLVYTMQMHMLLSK